MKLIRFVLGRIILFLNWAIKPGQLIRTPELQASINQELKSLTIYQFEACPFCVRVRRALNRLNLNIELRDVQKNKEHLAELMAGGGEYQVPCLRIKNPDGSFQWMYESLDIINYLENRFGAQVQGVQHATR